MDAERVAVGLVGRKVHHWLTVPRVCSRAVHIHKRETPLSSCLKAVWVPVRLHLLHHDRRPKGDEVTDIIKVEGMIVI